MKPGFYPDLTMEQYLRLDAVGAGRLGHMALSPKHYQHYLEKPDPETDATLLGTALHCAVLEPHEFEVRYLEEPDLEEITREDGKPYANPRATKEYKTRIATIEANGGKVLRADTMSAVLGMTAAIRNHPHAAAALAKAGEREVTFLWEYGETLRLCRGRADALGAGILVDFKSTRKLKYFSPWEVTQRGYHRKFAWYVDGLARLGNRIRLPLLIAVENVPPFDVGVFEVPEDVLLYGRMQNAEFMERLIACESSGEWPGMFPDVQRAAVTDALAAELATDDGVDVIEEAS